MKENAVLKKLKEGKPTIGSWVTLDSPLAAGIMARTGLDWVVVDTEHGALGYKEMLAAIHAVLLTPAVPIVRTTWSDTALIKRALDAGAMGILVPMVMTPNEAEQAAEAVRFPPKGRRSIGGLAAQTLHGDDYFTAANEQILLAVQIEHKDAVELAEEICRVEGVDLVFVGPYDLAASMGLLNCPFKDHPNWQEAVQAVLSAAGRAGKPAGIHASSAEEASGYLRQGFQFVAVSSDAQLLRSAVESIVAELKSRW